MTVNDDGYIEDAPQLYEGAVSPMEPIPVVEMSERRTPELASTMTWSIPATGGNNQPVQILQRTDHRFKAKVTIANLNGASSVLFSNTITTLQGTIASIPAGVATYQAVGNLPDWESQQPLYAIAIGGAGAIVSVIDERYL
jgi:hypothetical protein